LPFFSKVRKKKSLAERLTGFNPKDLPAFEEFSDESDSLVEPSDKEPNNRSEALATEHLANNLGSSCSNDLRAL